MNRLRRTATATFGVALIAVPVANATAAARHAVKKVIVVTKKVSGPQAQADQWGYVVVTLTVKKTTTIVGTKKTITRKITNMSIPVYPNHTDRSVYISNNALPMLMQQTMKTQNANVQMISGATYTSQAYVQSLQAALVLERKV
jgi:uncharacterized protein with FMN-binding domain